MVSDGAHKDAGGEDDNTLEHGASNNERDDDCTTGEINPMTMWIHRLMEKSLKGKDKVRYTYEGAEYGDTCKFHKAIQDWLIAPGETMGINMSLYCDDVMENDKEQRWPTRKAWWRGTAETSFGLRYYNGVNVLYS